MVQYGAGERAETLKILSGPKLCLPCVSERGRASSGPRQQCPALGDVVPRGALAAERRGAWGTGWWHTHGSPNRRKWGFGGIWGFQDVFRICLALKALASLGSESASKLNVGYFYAPQVLGGNPFGTPKPLSFFETSFCATLRTCKP